MIKNGKPDELRFRWKWIEDFLGRAIDAHAHISNEIVQDLMEMRVDAKLSRNDFAKMMGISSSYLFMIEQGTVPINDKILQGYLDALSGVKSDVRMTKRRGRIKA